MTPRKRTKCTKCGERLMRAGPDGDLYCDRCENEYIEKHTVPAPKPEQQMSIIGNFRVERCKLPYGPPQENDCDCSTPESCKLITANNPRRGR